MNPDGITAQGIIRIVGARKEVVVGLNKTVYDDARKESSLSPMTGFEADGLHGETKQGSEQIRDDFENSTFVVAVLKYVEDKTMLGNELIKRIGFIQE